MKKNADPSTIKGLRRERRYLLNIVRDIDRGFIPMTNESTGERRTIITDLLNMAADPRRRTFNPDLVKSALEIYSYGDAYAANLLAWIANKQHPELINYMKGLKEFEEA